MNKYFYLAFVFITIPFLSFSQNPQEQGFKKPPSIGKVYGRILDANTKQPVEFASVAAYSVKSDSVITGTLVKQNGDFLLEKLPLMPLKIKISFLGYKELEQVVTLGMGNMELDMGNLRLELDTKVLNEVVIGEEKSTMTMSIDRKVYNVDKDLSTKGGTASDIMKNIPSVTLDADGNASVRNSQAVIYMDGRPTTLTLDQIPADQVDRVEIITNASVKFDASNTGGILNIVMKSNQKPGYNGMLSAGIGTGNRYNATGNINIKKGAVNFSLSYSYNTRHNNNNGFTRRTNLSAGEASNYFNQDNINSETGSNQSVRSGVDIQLNNRNLLSMSGNFSYRQNDSKDSQTFLYENAAMDTTGTGTRLNHQLNNHYHATADIFLKHSFPKKGKELTVDVNYNYSNSERDYLFTTNSYDSNAVLLPDNPVLQRNDGLSRSNQFIFQLDYVNPTSENAKFEAGIRSYYQPYMSSNFTENYNYEDAVYQKDSVLSNSYDIKNMINAAYINYSGKMWWKIGFQAGLRFEESFYKGRIKDKEQEFSYYYPSTPSNILNSIFPGIYFTKEVAKNQDVQLNFSRKINRPNFFQLNPFIMGADKQNYRIGNPELTPEFTNMGELNYNPHKDKFNLLTSFYFKYTTNPISNYAYPSAADSLVLVNTFINGKSSLAYGLDNSLKLTLIKPLDITLNFNVFYTEINSSGGVGNKGFSFTSKANVTYRLPKDFTIQVNGSYEAPKIALQGTTFPIQFLDVTVSKSIKRKWTFTLSLSDAFNSKRFGSTFITPYYLQDASRRFETRYLKFTVSYIFGKQDANLFKKGSQKRPSGDNMEGDF